MISNLKNVLVVESMMLFHWCEEELIGVALQGNTHIHVQLLLSMTRS